eukprot:6181335-Pyramimonas_sp.AAC.1
MASKTNRTNDQPTYRNQIQRQPNSSGPRTWRKPVESTSGGHVLSGSFFCGGDKAIDPICPITT